MDTARLAPALAAGLGSVVAARAIRRRNRMDFKDRAVVITGGSRGLGLVLAREFAEEGARLAILARDRGELERAEKHIASRGAQVLRVGMVGEPGAGGRPSETSFRGETFSANTRRRRWHVISSPSTPPG